MSLYVIGDTHFSSDGRYSMDVFGGKWKDYSQKLIDGLSVLKENDLLLLCGDFSWGMSLSETLMDFKLLDAFPGKKILLKGNHDYYWDTVKKMKSFLTENGIMSIDFLHNNFFEYEGRLLCGTRGWMSEPGDSPSHDAKIYKREVIRLKYSLSSARESLGEKETLVFLYYPPVSLTEESVEMTGLMKEYGVKQCFYGHLHGDSIKGAVKGFKNGINYSLVSADALDFKPLKID